MKFREVAERVKSGEITLDECGHRTNATVERFVERYEQTLANSNGASDGKWNMDRRNGVKTIEEVNADMRDFYKRRLDNDCEDEKTSYCSFSCLGDGEYCFGCGEQLQWVLSGNKLMLKQYFDGNDLAIAPECEYAVIKPFTGSIQIQSRMIFANFFPGEDEPEGKRYSDEWSLNCLHGRKNIMDFKSKNLNVAYGQMGNMSIGIFVHPSKESIIIGDQNVGEHRSEGMTDAEWEASDFDELSVIEDHKLIGRIGLDVWRWEATDVKTLGDNYQQVLDNFRERCQEVVEVDAAHGTWDFEHFYEMFRMSDDYNPIYARLQLRK